MRAIRKTRRAPRRAIIAWIRDRAGQYDAGTGCRSALEELAARMEAGEDIDAYEHGELDDMLRRRRTP